MEREPYINFGGEMVPHRKREYCVWVIDLSKPHPKPFRLDYCNRYSILADNSNEACKTIEKKLDKQKEKIIQVGPAR